MTLTEFVEKGFLQEANRLFFHPLGLALVVTEQDDGTHVLTGVADARRDPEGFIFAEALLEENRPEFERKSRIVGQERLMHAQARRTMFDGLLVQPIYEARIP
jgi:hypothetical protein